MSGKKRPAIKIMAKRKGQGAKREDVCAVWVNDDGSLYVRLGEGVSINGEVVTSGKEGAWFVDGYVNEEVTLRPKSEPSREGRTHPDDAPQRKANDRLDFGAGGGAVEDDNDLPF